MHRRAAFWVATIIAISIILIAIHKEGMPLRHKGISISKEAMKEEAIEPDNIFYKRVKILSLEIFYREAGNPDRPALLLLYGFPSAKAGKLR